MADVARFVLHQANARILAHVGAALAVDPARIPSHVGAVGNCGAASAGLLLAHVAADLRLTEVIKGSPVVLKLAAAKFSGATPDGSVGSYHLRNRNLLINQNCGLAEIHLRFVVTPMLTPDVCHGAGTSRSASCPHRCARLPRGPSRAAARPRPSARAACR